MRLVTTCDCGGKYSSLHANQPQPDHQFSMISRIIEIFAWLNGNNNQTIYLNKIFIMSRSVGTDIVKSFVSLNPSASIRMVKNAFYKPIIINMRTWLLCLYIYGISLVSSSPCMKLYEHYDTGIVWHGDLCQYTVSSVSASSKYF